MVQFKDLKAFRIVVEGNEASEYYASYCAPSWSAYGLTVENFKATTPNDLKRVSELKFSKYSGNLKYSNLGINAEITPTEKAVFYSHYNLWKECSFLNEPILIMEHDSYLETPDNLWIEDGMGVIFYDKAAMGSYVMFPDFARKLIDWIYDCTIANGPYGTIAYFGVVSGLSKTIVNNVHRKFKPASNQVMSKKYGNTVSHYCTDNPHHWPEEAFHQFIEIE